MLLQVSSGKIPIIMRLGVLERTVQWQHVLANEWKADSEAEGSKEHGQGVNDAVLPPSGEDN